MNAYKVKLTKNYEKNGKVILANSEITVMDWFYFELKEGGYLDPPARLEKPKQEKIYTRNLNK